MFEEKINEWMIRNGFGDLEVIDDDEFMFEIDSKIIYFGVVSNSEGRWFEQFLHEYGLKYSGIPDEILALMHEIGHSRTIDYFDQTDLDEDYAAKNVIFFMDSSCEQMHTYWNLPMEFAANMWAVDFINNHIDAINELCAIYKKYYEEV